MFRQFGQPPVQEEQVHRRNRERKEDEKMQMAEDDMAREAGGIMDMPQQPEYQSLKSKNHQIDWKKVEEEDFKAAEQIIIDKGWDADVRDNFIDTDWCVACHLTAKVYSRSGGNSFFPFIRLLF
jgi:hypothetical protein